jgi:hypothetical protein
MEEKEKIEVATFKMSLKLKNEKEMKHECQVNMWQALAIGVILEKEEMKESDLKNIEETLTAHPEKQPPNTNLENKR